jgi:hypothetical protein
MVVFVTPAESGWRGPGAPRKQVPEPIVKMLEHARDTGKVGVIDIEGDSTEDVTEAINTLRAGARHMGRRINIQRDRQTCQIRFRIGEPIQ